MNIARSSIRLFGVKVTNAVVGFLAIAFFARELGPEQLGTFFLFQAVLSVLIISTDFGIRGAIEKRISGGQPPDRVLGTALVLKLPLLLVTAVGVLFFRTRLNGYIGAPLTDFLLVALLLQDASELCKYTLRGELRVSETASIDLARQFTWVGVSVVLILLGFGLAGLIYGLLAGLGVVVVWGGYKLATGLGTPTVPTAKSLGSYAKYEVVLTVGWQIQNWVDTLLIGWFLGQSAVGRYEVAWRVAGITLLLTRAVSVSVFPKISSLDPETEANRIESIIRSVITPSVVIIIPALFGTAFLAGPLLRFLFGAEYVGASLTLVVLVFGMLLNAVQNMFSQALEGLDHPDLSMKTTVTTAAVNFVANVVLIQAFGILGAAIATAIAYGLGLAMHTLFLGRYVRIRIPRFELWWCTLAAVVMAGVLRVITRTFQPTSLVELLGLVALAAAVYVAVVLSSQQLRTKFLTNVKRAVS